jgi:hypothetical protein
MTEQSVNDETQMLLKKSVVTRFNLLSRYFPGVIEENHEEHTE